MIFNLSMKNFTVPLPQNHQPSTINRQQTGKLLWTGVHLATWSWLSLILASPSASAAFPNYDLVKQRDFERCATSLNEAGVTPERASEACGMAIRPRILAQCVSRIGEYTSITAEDALSSCVRVRRPQELATCVVNITEGATDADPFNVLDSCRRSLLPEKYSFCVLGLKQSDINLPAPQLLETCLNPPETFLDLGLGTNQ